MKKTFLLICVLLCFAATNAQTDKPLVAIFTIDKTVYNLDAYVGGYLAELISQGGGYTAVDYSETFKKRLPSGVDYLRVEEERDKALVAVGKALGAKYVCVVKAENVMVETVLSARMVPTDGGIAPQLGKPQLVDKSGGLAALEEACRELMATMLGTSSDAEGEQMQYSGRAEYSHDEDEIYLVCDENPRFPGGDEAIKEFMDMNLRYPEEAKRNKITGRVYVQFVVEKDGSITNVKAARDIGGGCGDEAVRVVEMMPKWLPGKQRGKAVRAQFVLPIAFVKR